MDKSVDLLLRTGFRNAGSPEQGIYDCLAPIADVHEYAVGDSVSSALQRARQGSAPYIVFGDDSIAVSDQGAETLIRMLQRNRSIPGATLSTPALGKLFPLPPQEKRADAVRQSYLSIDRIPSWFCVLNRRLFSDDLWNTQYATLEFFLLELGLRLRGRVPGIFLLDDQLSFDARYWIKDLLNHKAGDLESDLARYIRAHESKNNHADVPPQFKIKVVGEFDAAPDTPLADAGCRAESPRFTIICPAYKPAYLRQAIESVLEQTYDDWELRILVDGPPEADRRRILEILSDYRNDPRIVVAEQENIGTGPTRRRLAQAARGAYLLTLDDDDMLVPTTLSAFASAIERYPDADFFRGGTRMVGLLDRYHAPRRRVVVDGISSDTFEVTQPFVIRRSALEELGGFEGDDSIKGAGEDTDLFLKVDRTGMRTIIIDRPLYRR
ncbi:MAG: glycosyltransferase, partial [Vicinamibacterales bacterium]